LVVRHGIAASSVRLQWGRSVGLDDTSGLALAHLLEAGELTASELSRRLLAGGAQTLAIVEALEQDGLLVARKLPGEGWDRWQLAPTDAARAVGPHRGALEGADAADRELVSRFVGAVAEAAERASASLAELSRDGR
jgi:hypothetical protein